MIHGLHFTPIDPQSIPPSATGGSRRSVYLATIKEFLLSGAKAVEIEADGKRPETVANQLNLQIRKANLVGQVQSMIRQGRVFLRRVAP